MDFVNNRPWIKAAAKILPLKLVKVISRGRCFRILKEINACKGLKSQPFKNKFILVNRITKRNRTLFMQSVLELVYHDQQLVLVGH
jgi:hypothetical protein